MKGQNELNAWLEQNQRPPLVMGVLNLTPDSFSDGGQFTTVEQAADRALQMADEGADWIDIGGESTRPGAERIPADIQLQRVLPTIQAIRRRSDIVLSIDTTLSAVARPAIDAGVDIVNDISAARDDEQMLPLAAAARTPIILMHMQGVPATMQLDPTYIDVVGEVSAFLVQRRDAAIRLGIRPQHVLLDPGIGFGKTQQHDLKLLAAVDRLGQLGAPLVVGTSRKRFIGRITGRDQPADRAFGTAATVAWAVANGAAVVRVHDVGPMRDVVRVVREILNSRP